MTTKHGARWIQSTVLDTNHANNSGSAYTWGSPATTGITANDAVIDLGGNFKITGSTTTGLSGNDLVPYSVVQQLLQGLSWKDPVESSSQGLLNDNSSIADAGTGSADAEYAAGVITATLAVSGTFSLDGATINDGDRVLIKNEGDAGSGGTAMGALANGIYDVGIAGTTLTLTRSSDMDAAAEFPSAALLIKQGSTNADSQWTCTNDAEPTVGTTGIIFAQISGASSIPDATGASGGGIKGKITTDTDTSGLSISSGEIAVNLATNPGLQITSGALELDLDTARGINKDATGAFVILESAGAGAGGLSFNGASGIRIDLGTTPGLELAADGLSALLDSTTNASSGLAKSSDGLYVKLESAGSGTGGLSYASADAGIGVNTGDGLGLDANGVRIQLTSDGGLALTGTAGSQTLGVDTSDGIDLDSNGVRINLTANGGLELTGTAGSQTLGAKVDGTSISKVTATGALQVDVIVEKRITQVLTISSGDETAGYKALSQDPIDGTAVTMWVKDANGASPLQEYGVDYTVMESGGTYSVVWKTSGTGLTGTHPTAGMTGDVLENDKVIVEYSYAAHTPAA